MKAKVLFLLLLSLCLGSSAEARRGHVEDSHGHSHGSPLPWNTLNVLGLHEQHKLQRARMVGPFADSQQRATAQDVGEISVLNDDGTLVTPANLFDLASRSVLFTPAGGGYRVAVGTLNVDAVTTVLPVALADDDGKELSIEFAFPFFGTSYNSVFVNSDGNLTFTRRDDASTERDLSRFLTGAPRIALFFNDLDPSVGGRVTYASEPGRFVVTWTDVPEWGEFNRNTFQLRLYPDGRIELVYGRVDASDAVIGISPGNFTGTPRLADLSASSGADIIQLPIAEVFAERSFLDLPLVTKRFYEAHEAHEAHEDAYDLLFIWTNFNTGFFEGGAFAAMFPVANAVQGIGLNPFNFSAELGSAGRVSGMLFMEQMSRYPDDPRQIFFRDGDSTLSVMAQEAGHRWGAYLRYPLESSPRSNVLLGRDNSHWSFFFNSDASVMEGNEIRDNGDGTFTTTQNVIRYNDLDQYAMGLRAPEEVRSSFVVRNPSSSRSPGSNPLRNITFSGQRMDATIDGVIQANRPRVPTSAIERREFTFAFVLVGERNRPASTDEIAKLDRFRREWEAYWRETTGGRSTANTRLVRGLSISGLPATTVPGVAVTARLRAGATSTQPRTFTLASSSAGTAAVPTTVTLPAGAREVEFRITSGIAGTARISAGAEGHETAEGVVTVGNASTLRLVAISGDAQVAQPSARLPNPIVVELQDAKNALPSGAETSKPLPVAGATINFTATGGATFDPPSAVTDATGRAQTAVTLGSTAGPVTLTATVAAISGAQLRLTATAFTAPIVPAGSAVNAASFAAAPAPITPGSIISIFGTNLSTAIFLATSTPLATRLGNVSVRINNVDAPIFAVTPGQLNVQVPVEVTGMTATIVVNNGVGSSTPITVPLSPSAPGIFTMQQTGSGAAAALLPDGRVVSATARAPRGSVVAIYCTGLGAVTPAVASGQAASTSTLSTTLTTPRVTIGGIPADVVFSGLAPGFVALYQVNVRVPDGVASGDQPLVITADAASNTVTLSVQ